MTMPFASESPLAASLRLQREDTPHAVALVTRVQGATAAHPGARTVIGADGIVISGFLGGGCVTGAVRRAAAEALRSGQPVMVALRPQAALDAAGVPAGETQEGWHYARNGCPSEGHVDIFVEPVLPAPVLIVLGRGPVADALVQLAEAMGATVTQTAPGQSDCDGFDWADALQDTTRRDAVIVATQGSGDREALRAALASPAGHIGFVASRRKAEKLRDRLDNAGIPQEAQTRIQAPTGRDIGARTPGEIALSILAELVASRRDAPAP